MNRFLVEKLLISLLPFFGCVIGSPSWFSDHAAKKGDRDSGEDEDDNDADDKYNGIYIGVGVIAGLILLAVVGFALFRCARRRRIARETQNPRNTTIAALRNDPMKQRSSISNENYSGPLYGSTRNAPSAPDDVIPNPMRASENYQDVIHEPPPPYFEHAPNSEVLTVVSVDGVDNHWKLKSHQ